MRFNALSDQSGFSALDIILVVLLVCAIGTAGFFAYKSEGSSKTASAKMATTIAMTTPTPSPANVPRATPPSSSSPGQTYLTVSQLGVKIPLKTGLNDLEYAYTTQGDQPYLYFSSASLVDADPGCAISISNTISPLGLVVILKSPASNPDSSDFEDGTLMASNVNGYYLYYRGPQDGCSTLTAAQSLQNSQLTVLQAELKGTVAE